MAGPNPIPAPGTNSRTAVARTWAAECRRSPRASGSREVRIRISRRRLDGEEEVQRPRHSTTAPNAALASPGPMAAATSPALDPFGSSRTVPSGRVTLMISFSHGSHVPVFRLREKKCGSFLPTGPIKKARPRGLPGAAPFCLSRFLRDHTGRPAPGPVVRVVVVVVVVVSKHGSLWIYLFHVSSSQRLIICRWAVNGRRKRPRPAEAGRDRLIQRLE